MVGRHVGLALAEILSEIEWIGTVTFGKQSDSLEIAPPDISSSARLKSSLKQAAGYLTN
jgi:hypothetical protein